MTYKMRKPLVKNKYNLTIKQLRQLIMDAQTLLKHLIFCIKILFQQHGWIGNINSI